VICASQLQASAVGVKGCDKEPWYSAVPLRLLPARTAHLTVTTWGLGAGVCNVPDAEGGRERG
jgi:hypothetical protein